MEDVDRMRLLYQETGSIRKVAKIMGISRNTVKNYLNRIEECKNGHAKEIIPVNVNRERTGPACTNEVKEKIYSILEDNQNKPKKQRLNATHIFNVLVSEDIKISYPTVRREVKSWKEKNVFKDISIAQDYESGYRSECDWGKVTLKIPENPQKYSLFVMVLNNSLYRFGRVYPDESQNNVFYGLIEFFHEIGGVPENIFFDNMKTVVTSPQDKVFNERFLQFAAHYGFRVNACNPHSPQEKGTVEKSVSVIRKSAFGQSDSFNSLKEANEYLKKVLLRINGFSVANRELIPLDGLELERRSLLPLPSMDFQPYDLKYRKVNSYSTVSFERNFYSVPESCKSESLALKIYLDIIEIYEGETLIAQHNRLFGKNNYSLAIEHYLSTLRNKPGSLRSSKVLKTVDPCLKSLYFDHYLDKPKGFIQILGLLKKNSQEELVVAVTKLLELSIIPDYESTKLALNYKEKEDFGEFNYQLDIEIPEPNLKIYDGRTKEEKNNG